MSNYHNFKVTAISVASAEFFPECEDRRAVTINFDRVYTNLKALSTEGLRTERGIVTEIVATGIGKKATDRCDLYGPSNDMTMSPAKKQRVIGSESSATARDSQATSMMYTVKDVQMTLKTFTVLKIKIEVFRDGGKFSAITLKLYQKFTALVFGAVDQEDVKAALNFVSLLVPRNSIALSYEGNASWQILSLTSAGAWKSAQVEAAMALGEDELVRRLISQNGGPMNRIRVEVHGGKTCTSRFHQVSVWVPVRMFSDGNERLIQVLLSRNGSARIAAVPSNNPLATGRETERLVSGMLSRALGIEHDQMRLANFVHERDEMPPAVEVATVATRGSPVVLPRLAFAAVLAPNVREGEQLPGLGELGLV